MSFSSLSPSTVVFNAFKTYNLFSSIWQAIEYSIISILVSYDSNLDAISFIIDCTFKSSSMKLRSRTCLMSLLCSMAAQKSIGAAFLKFNQNVWSPHSAIKFSKTESGGCGIPPGMPVVLTRSAASVILRSSLSLSFYVCSLRECVAVFLNISSFVVLVYLLLFNGFRSA